MLELAPNHKAGLAVANPILLGGGVVGCAEYPPQSLKEAGLGAVVVGPFTLSSRRGATPPRLAVGLGGYVLQAGLQNRGAGSSVKRFGRTWRRLGVPVVAQIADIEPEDALRTAAHLARSEAVAGLELLVHPASSEGDVHNLVASLALEGELPLWVKLPYANASQLAPVAARAGAGALVVCQASDGDACHFVHDRASRLRRRGRPPVGTPSAARRATSRSCALAADVERTCRDCIARVGPAHHRLWRHP